MAVEHFDSDGHSVAIRLAERLFYKNRRVVRRIDTALHCARAKRYGNRLEHCVYRQYCNNCPPYLPSETYDNYITACHTWHFEYNLVYGILCYSLPNCKFCNIDNCVRVDICNIRNDYSPRYNCYDTSRTAIRLVRLSCNSQLLYLRQQLKDTNQKKM